MEMEGEMEEDSIPRPLWKETGRQVGRGMVKSCE